MLDIILHSNFVGRCPAENYYFVGRCPAKIYYFVRYCPAENRYFVGRCPAKNYYFVGRCPAENYYFVGYGNLSLSLSPPPVERFTVLLQFMCSSEVVDIPFSEFQDSIKAAVGYGFCLLTQLLQDKNSNVCARAKFCISNISDISLRVSRVVLYNKEKVYPLW